MDAILLKQLAKRLSLTDLDGEPESYILTKDEEDRVIENERRRLVDYAVWKMANMGMSIGDIELKVAEINWDERIDREAVLWQANSAAHQKRWHEERRVKEKELEISNREELKKVWTAERVYKLMTLSSREVFDKRLIVNDDNKKLITALCFFVSGDDRFEKDLNYSFKRGLLIRGSTGIGKTHIVRCVESNELNPILTISMLDISDEIKATGEYRLVMGDRKIIYLDDVGTEEPVIYHYGTKIMWFKQLIETAYLKSKSFSNIIISTNLNFSAISERYGFRVASRMREMFNVVDVSGQDMRV